MVNKTYLAQIHHRPFVIVMLRTPACVRLAVREISCHTTGVLKRRDRHGFMQCEVRVRQIPSHRVGFDHLFFILDGRHRAGLRAGD